MRIVHLLVPLLLVGSYALAEEPVSPPIADTPPVTTPTAEAPLPADAAAALAVWEASWRDVPQLVSLQAQPGDDADARDSLQKRLKLLGEKTFSNREWKAYWESQATTASAVASAVRPTGRSEAASAFDAWATLARDKVANQDTFFEAIEKERDALEERIEAMIEAPAPPSDATPTVTDPNPYERRRQRVEEVERRLAVQEQKRALVVADVAFIQRQLESEDILTKALRNDLDLARREHALAVDAAVAPQLTPLWSTIADRAKQKVIKLEGDFQYGEVRARGRQVEAGLATSQIAFREARIAELREELVQAASLRTWITATGETVLTWFQAKAWRILIALAVVYVGVRFALRMTNRAVVIILERTDDNPDVDDDNDQRRQTLADVFTGVARIGIYIVGGLIALEQIGINTGPIMGSVAILGLAISFGSQNLVRDVVNGFFILLENQFAVGDVVTLNGNTGSVEKITIRSTWIRAATGDLHVVPNGAIGVVSNLTRGWSKATVEIGVSYAADLDHVRDVINRAGQEMYADVAWSTALQEAPTWIGVTALGDSSVVVRTQAKVVAGQQWAITRELYRRLKVAFDTEQIEIPFPQTVLHQAGK